MAKKRLRNQSKKRKQSSILTTRELSRMDHFFLLHLKASLRVIIIWLASLIIHNLISVIFGFEEIVFFILSVVLIPIYLVISVIYTLIRHKKWHNEFKGL